ncbi:MAG: DUF2304 domain-containing protein [Bacteroidales bacterium]|nr:DUF2304 domain-containing protein [Bacteroidales bacterium]
MMVLLPRLQIIAISGSIFFIFLLVYLIRKQRIKEEYSLLWLFFGFIFLLFSIWRDGLDYLAGLVGIAYPPAALFMLFILAFFFILIEFSVIISRLSDRNKNLTQEVAIQKAELKELKKKIKHLLRAEERSKKEKEQKSVE